jgi:predicted transcriptional regulator YdeE
MENSVAQSEVAPSVQIVELPAFAVMGPHTRTENRLEMSGEGGRIGPLWKRFMSGEAEAIAGVLDQETVFAVYSNYESDENGPYDVTLGKSVKPQQQTAAGIRIIHIPAARYAVFPIAASTPESVMSAWVSVYRYFAASIGHHRAFTCDYERYAQAGAQIYIAIR